MGGGAILLFAVMLAVVVVLVAGITLMARGGEANRKYGNKLMMARVVLQGLALAIVAVLLMMKNKGA